MSLVITMHLPAPDQSVATYADLSTFLDNWIMHIEDPATSWFQILHAAQGSDTLVEFPEYGLSFNTCVESNAEKSLWGVRFSHTNTLVSLFEVALIFSLTDKMTSPVFLKCFLKSLPDTCADWKEFKFEEESPEETSFTL